MQGAAHASAHERHEHDRRDALRRSAPDRQHRKTSSSLRATCHRLLAATKGRALTATSCGAQAPLPLPILRMPL
eukprot:3149356-Rhodomonas_salina.7